MGLTNLKSSCSSKDDVKSGWIRLCLGGAICAALVQRAAPGTQKGLTGWKAKARPPQMGTSSANKEEITHTGDHQEDVTEITKMPTVTLIFLFSILWCSDTRAMLTMGGQGKGLALERTFQGKPPSLVPPQCPLLLLGTHTIPSLITPGTEPDTQGQPHALRPQSCSSCPILNLPTPPPLSISGNHGPLHLLAHPALPQCLLPWESEKLVFSGCGLPICWPLLTTRPFQAPRKPLTLRHH